MILSYAPSSLAYAQNTYEQELAQITSDNLDTLTEMNAYHLAAMYTAEAYISTCANDPDLTSEKKLNFSKNKERIIKESLSELFMSIEQNLNSLQNAATEEMISHGCESKIGLRGKKGVNLYSKMTKEAFELMNALVSNKLKDPAP